MPEAPQALTQQEEQVLQTGGDAPEVAALPETPAAPEAPKPVDPKDQLVQNYKAMAHEERMARKQLEQHVKTMEERFAVMQQKMTEPPPAPVPKFEEDPLANLKADNETLKRQLSEITGAMRQGQTVNAQQAAVSNFLSSVASVEQEFIKAQPDYKEAVDFLREIRIGEMDELGIPREAALQRAYNMEVSIAKAAVDAGRNPAQAVYNMARKMGFKAQAKETEKLAAIEAGQQAARSVGSGTPNKATTLEDIAKLDTKEFERLYGGEDAWRKLHGAV